MDMYLDFWFFFGWSGGGGWGRRKEVTCIAWLGIYICRQTSHLKHWKNMQFLPERVYILILVFALVQNRIVSLSLCTPLPPPQPLLPFPDSVSCIAECFILHWVLMFFKLLFIVTVAIEVIRTQNILQKSLLLLTEY